MKISRVGRQSIVRKSGENVTDKSKCDSEEVLQIFPNARIYKTTLTKKFRERKKYKKPDIQEIKSIIPGEVISLDVAQGESVTKGTQLMIFEAMKMHNIVAAPIDGTIDIVYVKEGQKVSKGETLILIKASKKLDQNSTSKEKGCDYIKDNDDFISDDDLGLIV